jgi:hypothetical protein
MARLPEFSRVLVVVPPHGGYIIGGEKKALVKSRHYRMDNEQLLVVQQKTALGVITLEAPREINLAEFRRTRSKHLVTEKERLKWWKGKTRFWYYPVRSVHRLRAPIPVQYPNGPQVFVRKTNLRVKSLRPAT